MHPATVTARELTKRLVADARSAMDSADRAGPPESVALSAASALEHTFRALDRSLGAEGAYALVTRAIAQAEATHPLLRDIRLGSPSKPQLTGVAGAITAHGAPAAASALDATIEILLSLLGRLIGDDMVARLVLQRTTIELDADEDTT